MSASSTALLHNTTDANVKESELINSGRDTNYNVQNNYNIAVFYDVIGFFQTAAQLFVALISVNQLTRADSTDPLPQAATDDDAPQSSIPDDSVEISDIMPQDPSLLPVSSIADRYTRSMLECLVGYPLYEPHPFSELSEEYSHKGVHVGDVGFITEDGAFDFLFNICPPQNDLINPPNLPDGFSLKTSKYSRTRPLRPLSCGTCHFSRTVTKTESGEYICKGSEGAILVLPEGAIRDAAIHRREFEDLAKLHGVEWYEYTLNRGRSISNGSLYLVTSFVKCTQWGTAVFDRPCEPGQALRFVSSPLGWKGLGALTTEVANPNQDDNSNQLPKRQRASRIRGGGGSDFMSRIQSILSDRRRLSRTTMSTTKKPEDVVLNPSFNSSPVHPSDLINAALMSQHPAAKVALTHDDVWCDLLRDNFPELTYASLMNITQSYTSTIDENGCVSLEKISDSTNVLDESSYSLQGTEVPALQKAIPDDRKERNPVSMSSQGSIALRPPSADPPFTWNIPRGRPSLQLSSLEDLFQSNPKLSRSRRLDTYLASAVQAEYYSLSEQQTFATTQAFTESDIYSRLMLKRRYGYPLYRPEPLKDLPVEYCRNGVRIGDVGRITPDGAFDFLFNVDSTHASTVNPSTLPCDFETVPPIKITFEDFFRHGAQIFSDHVVQIKDKHIITYNCSATEGAVLHLPENTILFNAQNKDELCQLAARHAYRWYEYLVINRSQDITNGSLYLVTDCIKTTNWGIGVFNHHKPESDYLEFVSQEQGPGRRYGWRMLGPIVAKIAPTGEENAREQNQCVFLLGFKIALNHGLWRRLQSMAPNRAPTAEKFHQMSPSYSSHSNYSGFTLTSLRGSTLLSSPIRTRKDSLEVQETIARLEGDSISTRSQQVLLQQIFGAICPVHPSDFINVMLLSHEPDANIAIVHDDEWRDLLPNNFAVDPRQLHIKDFLENVAKSRISMNDDGCVSLKWKLSVKWADIPARASSEILPLGSQAELINFSPVEDQARLSPQDPLDNNAFVPTTTTAAEQCPRFRILLVGRSGIGKTSLINSIFKTSLPVSHNRAGEANIEREITSSYNEYLVVHDSEGYEPGDPRKLEVVKKFITKRCNATDFTERLHAVWLCIATPYGKAKVLETGHEEICSLEQLGVPVIIVFTKYDLFLDRVKYDLRIERIVERGDDLLTKAQNAAKKKFESEYMPALRKSTNNKNPGKIPYVCVSRQHWESLEELVQTTLKHISISPPKQPQLLLKGIFRKRVGTLDEDHNVSSIKDYSDPRVLVLAIAQRIDVKSKLGASISVGKRKYWNGLASGLHFRNNTIWRCLQVIHIDIINVWNIKDMSEYLLSDDFRQRIAIIVSDLSPDVPGQRTSTTLAELLSEAGDRTVSAGPAAVIMAPIAATMALVAWVHEIYNQAPHIIRCFMGYIVDLTVIVQTLFKISAQSSDGNIGIIRAEEILHNFAGSQIKENIHAEIRMFVNGLRTRFERDLIIEKIDSLIYSNKDAEL